MYRHNLLHKNTKIFDYPENFPVFWWIFDEKHWISFVFQVWCINESLEKRVFVFGRFHPGKLVGFAANFIKNLRRAALIHFLENSKIMSGICKSQATLESFPDTSFSTPAECLPCKDETQESINNASIWRPSKEQGEICQDNAVTDMHCKDAWITQRTMNRCFSETILFYYHKFCFASFGERLNNK